MIGLAAGVPYGYGHPKPLLGGEQHKGSVRGRF
jgi:hypothetical protein